MLHQEDMSAISMALDATEHPGEWRKYDVTAVDALYIARFIKRQYPWLEVRTSSIIRGTIELLFKPVQDRSYRHPLACGCGYDDCPACNPQWHERRCSYCGGRVCTRHEHRDPTQFDQTKTWNGRTVESMSCQHLENTIAYIRREYNLGPASSPLVARMMDVLNAKRVLGIDEVG